MNVKLWIQYYWIFYRYFVDITYSGLFHMYLRENDTKHEIEIDIHVLYDSNNCQCDLVIVYLVDFDCYFRDFLFKFFGSLRSIRSRCTSGNGVVVVSRRISGEFQV